MPVVRPAAKNDKDRDLLDGTTFLGEANYAPANYVRSNFSHIVEISKNDKEKTLITEHSRPAAAVVPVSGFRILKFLDVVGLTDRISEITYEDMSIEGALEELSKAVERATLETHNGANNAGGGAVSGK